MSALSVITTYEQLGYSGSKMVDELLKMCPSSNCSLKDYLIKFDFYNRFMLAPPEFDFSPPYTIGFDTAQSFNETISPHPGKNKNKSKIVQPYFTFMPPLFFIILSLLTDKPCHIDICLAKK